MTVDVTINKTESKFDTINEEKEEENNENSN